MLIRKLKTEKEYEIVISRSIQWSSDKMELFPRVQGKSNLSNVLFFRENFSLNERVLLFYENGIFISLIFCLESRPAIKLCELH